MNPLSGQAAVRDAAVAGTFYPSTAASLSHMVEDLLSQFSGEQVEGIRALIVPHAGYVYSGITAAHAYALLQQKQSAFDTVYVFGPAHRVAIEGMATVSYKSFATPLGEMPVSTADVQQLVGTGKVTINNAAHLEEHCIEVQIPFLQRAVPDCSLVPVLVGDQNPTAIADLMTQILQDPRTLIILSTDLSHFLPADHAELLDQKTTKAIVDLDDRMLQNHNCACGSIPLAGLLRAARQAALQCTILGRTHSGATTGDMSSVVGYISAFLQDPNA